MKILNVKQGTPEWHEARQGRFCASDAAAMLGLSKYTSRTELLDRLASGITPDVSAQQQYLFDKGHAAEESARHHAEKFLGEDLYPVVGVSDIDGLPLLASFDGLTMDESTAWEHKLWNRELATYTLQNADVPDTHWPQLEQQLLVSGADAVMFTVSDGTTDNMANMLYRSHADRRQRLIDGWKQFSEDLLTHVVTEKTVKVEAEPVMALPALSIQVGGEITIKSNLDRFGERLKAYIAETNAKPETDLDFANLEQACKVLKEAEDALKRAEANALAQTATVDDLRRTVSYLSDMARTNRLMFEKLVKTEKENRKQAIVSDAMQAFKDHRTALQAHCPVALPEIKPDFAAAIKGKKTLSSMQDAVNTLLADAKIDTFNLAQDYKDKRTWFLLEAGDYQALFADITVLMQKPRADFEAAVKIRIADFKQQEAERLEREEKARLADEIKAKADAELKAQQQADADQKAREEHAKQAQLLLEQARNARERAQYADGQAYHDEMRQAQQLETKAKQIVAEQQQPANDAPLDINKALLDALVKHGLLKSKLLSEAVATLNAQQHGQYNGYRAQIGLCKTLSDIATVMNDMPAEAKAALKPLLTAQQTQIKQAA